jgi:selenocysteine lyase/cysteine desulfurase
MTNKSSTDSSDGYSLLEQSIYLALQMYSNVHRGAGHNSLVSTKLFDQSREIVLNYLGLDNQKYVTLFLNSKRAKVIKAQIGETGFKEVTSQEIGLPLGVHALAVEKSRLPKGIPFETGGGTVRVVSENHVLWAGPPDRYEAGTPAIMNIIAFGRGLQLHQKNRDAFKEKTGDAEKLVDLMSDPVPGRKSGEELLTWVKPQLVGRNVQVPTEAGLMAYTNLDNGASTPTFEPIWDCFQQSLHVPKSNYRLIVEEATRICQNFLGAPEKDYELIFTSNTTESLNTFAQLASASLVQDEEITVLNLLIEHNSNELPWRYTKGFHPLRLEVDGDGFIDATQLEITLKEHYQSGTKARPIRWVSISGASNVLGALNDLDTISAITHKYGALMLVDAAQLIAHRPINMLKTGIDALVFSGHKIYAPFGSGALILRKSAFKMDPGVLDGLKESGEENVTGIASLAGMLSLLGKIGMEKVEEDERALTIQLLEGLKTVGGLDFYGIQDADHPRMSHRSGVVTLTFREIPFNITSNRLAEIGGIGVRSGCFCSHLLVKRLLKVGPFKARLVDIGFIFLSRFTKLVMPGLVRISIGLENTPAEIDHCIDTVRKVAGEKQSRLNRMIARSHNGSPFFHRPLISNDIDDFVEDISEKVFPE